MQGTRSFVSRRPWLAAALGFLLLAGCGGSRLHPVHGKLVYDEDGDPPVKELAGYDVTFTSEKLGISSRGTIKEDGSFDLTTTKENDGAYPGEYVVVVTQPHRRPERPFVGDPVVDLSYEDPAKSKLKAEVKPDKNDFTFKLQRIK
jgi:hypothetical protein